MTECKGCKNVIVQKVKIDGKWYSLHSRKYCLTCSPFGTRKKCGVVPKPRNGDQYCKTCGKKYKSKKNLECPNCRGHKTRESIKNRALEFKGGKCKICGYNKSKKSLIFHHRNPEEKSFTLSSFWNYGWNYVKNEVEKCDLLCANCHGEIHDKLEKENRSQRFFKNTVNITSI